MWFSRYWLMIPVLAIAGSLAAKKIGAGGRRDPADAHAAVHRPAVFTVLLVGALTFVPALALGPDRRAPDASTPRTDDDMTRKTPSAARSRARRPRDRRFVRKLDPRTQARNPVMFVVFIGSLLTTWLWIDALRGQGEAPAWFIGNRRAVAVVHRALRQLRRGARRRPQQGAGDGACAACARRYGRSACKRAATRAAPSGPSRPKSCARATSS